MYDVSRITNTPVIATVLTCDDELDEKIEAGASIINVAAGRRTPDVVQQIRQRHPSIPLLASGGSTDESMAETIVAGANALTWTPAERAGDAALDDDALSRRIPPATTCSTDVRIPNMSSTSNNAAVTGNDAVDDVMATSQSAENGTSHDTADGDIKNDVLSSFISIGRIMAYRAIHRRLVSPGAKSPRGEHAFDPRRGQGRVLATLRESDQTSQKDLAAMFGMSRQAMAELLKKLEASGHISRRPSRRDSRVMMVSLTNQGRKAADLLGKAPDQTSSMLDCLNETELQTLHG